MIANYDIANQTSAVLSPWMRLRSSEVSMFWKSADDTATPPTCPVERL